ncbi:MAG: prolyl oligopeptidase family serine peptidase [Gemmataceae bacterium]
MSVRSTGLLFVVGAFIAGTVVAQPPLDRLRKNKTSDGKADTSKLTTVTWKIGDATREALLHKPGSTDAKRPVVFAFHGHGGKAEHAARRFAFHQHWPEAVCVYPQGLPTAVPGLDPNGKLPGWQKYIGDQKDRDIELFDAMLKTLTADYQIDEKRVYVAGHSNGGFFTYILWAARGDKLAAVAPVAATASIRDFRSQKPLPVLHVAGEADRIVKFAGQELTIGQVRKLNGCDSEGHAAGKWCTEYRSSNGPSVVAYIHPGGHEIPEGAPERIVRFFQEHPRK